METCGKRRRKGQLYRSWFSNGLFDRAHQGDVVHVTACIQPNLQPRVIVERDDGFRGTWLDELRPVDFLQAIQITSQGQTLTCFAQAPKRLVAPNLNRIHVLWIVVCSANLQRDSALFPDVQRQSLLVLL